MRISDLLWLAIKNLKIKLIALPVATIAISAFCLCFAGAVLATMQQETSLPYELKVISNSAKLSDSTLAAISGIPDVMAVTPLLEVPVSVKTGGYKAQMTLAGINPIYIKEAFAQGGVFPDSSAMPYIVLNKAACRLFADEKSDGTDTEPEEPTVDWLNAAISVQTSDGTKPVAAKIVGLLSKDDKGQEPIAYISIASAKALLQRDGLRADYFEAAVRVANARSAEGVSKAIADLGLNILNSNEELPNKWDMETKEMTYLILISVICLISALIFTVFQIKTFQLLRWVGMTERMIGWLSIIQTALIGLSGILIGIAVSAFVPSFIPPEVQETTIFSLKISFGTGAFCFAICVLAWVIPSWVWLKRVKG